MNKMLCLTLGFVSIAAPASAAKPGQVEHHVYFRFKRDVATQSKVPATIAAFKALRQTSIDPTTGRKLVQELSYGFPNSTEGQDKGMDVGFRLRFKNVADRNYYVDTEAHHQAFKAMVGPLLDDKNPAIGGTGTSTGNPGVIVFDYEIVR